jgi:hypothetical protein
MPLGLNQKQMNLLIVVFLAGALGFLIWTQLAIVDEAAEDEFPVTAKWEIYCKDLLDEGSAAASGTLAIYDPANPGEALETGLSISSGKFTTAEPYTSGETIFIKYTDTTYFDYGMLLEIPFWDSDLVMSTVPTLPHPDYIYVIKMADTLQGASNTDVDGLKNGAASWDDSATALSAFNRTLDGNYPKLGVMVTNEDVETSYVDYRGYIDLSQPEEEGVTWNLGSYFVLEFTPTSTWAYDVNDYLRFQTWPSGMVKKKAGANMYLFYPLTSDDAGYIYDVVGATTNPDGDKDGNCIIFEITFDFSGAIASNHVADMIDIEVSMTTGASLSWFDKYESLSFTTDDPLGNMATAYTNDWSIGWT